MHLIEEETESQRSWATKVTMITILSFVPHETWPVSEPRRDPKVRDRRQVLLPKAHVRYSPATHRPQLCHPCLGWRTAACVPALEAHPSPPHPEWQGQLSPMTNVPWLQSHSLCLTEFCPPHGSSRTLHGNHQLCGVLIRIQE